MDLLWPYAGRAFLIGLALTGLGFVSAKMARGRREMIMSHDCSSTSFRVRYRFRVQKKLYVGDFERQLSVGGMLVVLSTEMPEKKIMDDEWLVMNACGFKSEDEAKDFAVKLKAASQLSSVIARIGIDAGVDRPTSGFGKIIKDALETDHRVILRDNTHGIDVFPDEQNIRFGKISGIGVVHAAPDPFLSDIDHSYRVIVGASKSAEEMILLMNYALTRIDPVATIVFAVSAVEMLGQKEKWSDAQTKLLGDLANAAEQSETGTAEENAEVAAAIRGSIHKLSLRQGVLRLLASLNLSHLKKQWVEMYNERSNLVHGLAPKPGIDYGDQAHRTINLCGHILLKRLASEVPGVDRHVDRFYPVN